MADGIITVSIIQQLSHPQYEAGFWTAYKLRASRANLRYKALFCSKIDSLYDSTSTSEKEEIVHQEGRSTICPYST